jgi:hypothetical protein
MKAQLIHGYWIYRYRYRKHASPIAWRRHAGLSHSFWLSDTVSGSSHYAVIYGHKNTSGKYAVYNTNDLNVAAGWLCYQTSIVFCLVL